MALWAPIIVCLLIGPSLAIRLSVLAWTVVFSSIYGRLLNAHKQKTGNKLLEQIKSHYEQQVKITLQDREEKAKRPEQLHLDL